MNGALEQLEQMPVNGSIQPGGSELGGPHAGPRSAGTTPPGKKKKGTGAIGVLGLASLAFFAVAGTPAGSEDTIAAAGPRLGLAGFLLMPLVWSIPEALVTAELATTFPHNGGFVIWVTEAFGQRLGYQEGLLKWVSGTLDNAVYPVMMLNYVMKVSSTGLGLPYPLPCLRRFTRDMTLPGPKAPILCFLGTVVPCSSTRHPRCCGHGLACLQVTTAFDSDTAQMAFPIAVVFVLSTAQATGLEIVGVTSSVLILVTLLPFLVMIVLGLPQVEPSRLLVEREEPVAWALFLTNLFWNLNYWDSVSTIAAEAENPGQTFPRALTIAVSLTVLMYVLTLGVAIGTAEEGHDWDSSELADAGKWIAGEWLQIWIVISVAISAAGLYLAEISTDIFMLSGMAEMGMMPKVNPT